MRLGKNKIHFLEAPITYQGGKKRIAEKIVDIIEFEEGGYFKKGSVFNDFCSGSGAITLEVFNRYGKDVNINMYDVAPMIDFYKMCLGGTFCLDKFKSEIDSIPKDKSLIRDYLKELNKSDFTIYKYLILQSGSFGGKQISFEIFENNYKFKNNTFRNYWMPTETSNRRSPVNPMMPMPETLYDNVSKVVVGLKSATNIKTHKVDLNVNLKYEDGINYIDPPYEDTSKYSTTINNEIFYKKFEKIYISEYKKLSDDYYMVNESSKGGINGKSKIKNRQEILNIVKNDRQL